MICKHVGSDLEVAEVLAHEGVRVVVALVISDLLVKIGLLARNGVDLSIAGTLSLLVNALAESQVLGQSLLSLDPDS